MFCTNCGKEIPEGNSFCTDCGTPSPSLSSPKRTGVIVGSVAAAVIVLAGIGVGLWLGLRGDDETAGVAGADASATTIAGAGSPENPSGITSTGDPTLDYVNAVDDLVVEMDYYHVRIPELASIINENVPDTPQAVYDELADMANFITTAMGGLEGLPVPAGYETADYWVKQAGAHMLARVQATMDGIEAMWTGPEGSATPFFNKGRAERDAYEAAIIEYFASFGST